MTRLQKKCLIAAAGTHFLLVIVLLCSGFIRPKPKVDNTQLLDVIPDTAIDQAFQSGVRNAPPPTPVVVPTPPPPVPQPEPPKPVQPTEPPKQVEPVPPPKIEEPVVPKSEEPLPTKPKPQPHKVEVNLKEVVRKAPTDTSNKDDEAKADRDAKRQRDARLKAFRTAITSIEKHASTSTEVNMPGDSSVSYASYGAIVVSVYHHAWIAPDNMSRDSAIVSFSVTISHDGTVISSHIDAPSGDANVNNAVQRMLDRVRFIHEFPADSTDRERTYHIDFNANKASLQ